MQETGFEGMAKEWHLKVQKLQDQHIKEWDVMRKSSTFNSIWPIAQHAQQAGEV